MAIAGCVGAPNTERADEATSIDRRALRPVPRNTLGWPGGEKYKSTTYVTYQDDYVVEVRSDVVVFPDEADFLDLKGKHGNFFLNPWKTHVGLMLFHRPARSTQAWTPLTCGDNEKMTSNGIGYFEDWVGIDRYYQEVILDDDDSRAIPFRECGITEQNPEIAAFVFVRSNPGDMRGDFEYELEAVCDQGDCPTDRFRYDPARFNVPGAGGRSGGYYPRQTDTSRDRYRSTGSREICNDRVDNDGDRYTDCSDTDCYNDYACGTGGSRNTGSREICDDSRDNDGDGRFDCNDTDCSADARCSGTSRTGSRYEDCSNRFDDDGDNRVDCNDSDCLNNSLCRNSGREEPCDCYRDSECVVDEDYSGCYCDFNMCGAY